VEQPDPFNLQRFVDAQADGIFEQALAELAEGHKHSHWMWFIFPQHRDLGRSQTARYYGLSGEAEAAAFADHPILGARLRTCIAAIRPHLAPGQSAAAILGDVDALKFRSCLDIFAAAVPGDPAFRIDGQS
jgi:uncharacterized protein (DUF1810 family)